MSSETSRSPARHPAAVSNVDSGDASVMKVGCWLLAVGRCELSANGQRPTANDCARSKPLAHAPPHRRKYAASDCAYAAEASEEPAALWLYRWRQRAAGT